MIREKGMLSLWHVMSTAKVSYQNTDVGTLVDGLSLIKEVHLSGNASRVGLSALRNATLRFTVSEAVEWLNHIKTVREQPR